MHKLRDRAFKRQKLRINSLHLNVLNSSIMHLTKLH